MMDPKQAKRDSLDAMWAFLQMGGQKANRVDVETLMDECAWLVKAMTQKQGGDVKRLKNGNVDWSELEAHENFIILGTLVLYLSGSLERLRDIMEQDQGGEGHG
jgi:hypothetical protein